MGGTNNKGGFHSPLAEPLTIPKLDPNRYSPDTKYPPGGQINADYVPVPISVEPIINRTFTPAGPGGAMCNGSNPPATENPAVNQPRAKWPSMDPGLSNDGRG